jgi:protein-tyrosine phosphatase
MNFTELPLNLPGRVYRSAMPYNFIYDAEGAVYEAYRKAGIDAVVLLTDDQETLAKAGKNLREMYLQDGLEVIYLPVEDFGTPDVAALQDAVGQTAAAAQNGKNIAIHCSAGKGRTGSFAACLAGEVLGLSGDEAISWVRQYVPGSVETPGQIEMVRSYLTPAYP